MLDNSAAELRQRQDACANVSEITAIPDYQLGVDSSWTYTTENVSRVAGTVAIGSGPLQTMCCSK